MTILDTIIVIGLITALILIGLGGNSKAESTEEFFLAGRQLRWWQIGFSLFATNFSASAIIGLTGAAYLTGIAIYNYEWVGILAMVFFAFVLAKVVRNSQVYTIADYLTQRYDARIKTAYSVFIIFLIVFIDMAGSLYAGGLLLSQIIPSLSMNGIIFLIMVLAGIYSVIGGLKAISRTDMFQSLILIAGAFLIFFYTMKAVGGWSNMASNAAPESLSLIRGLDDRAVPWTGLLTGIPVLCAYFWLTNQNMVQWVLSAKSVPEARKGLLMAGYLKLLVLFVIIIPGVAAVQIIPDLAEADRIYPALLLELLPSGVLGIVLAGFVAALMSNTDSTLHAASTIITMDFVRRKYPNVTPRRLVWSGRLITVIIIIISAIWAPMIGQFGTLFEYVQGLLSYAVAPFVVVYLGGLFWPRANTAGAVTALSVGGVTALIIAILQRAEIIEVHYLHVPLPISLLCLVALICGSILTSAPKAQSNLLWAPNRDRNIQTSDLWVAGCLIALTLLQVYIFR